MIGNALLMHPVPVYVTHLSVGLGADGNEVTACSGYPFVPPPDDKYPHWLCPRCLDDAAERDRGQRWATS